MKRLAVLCFALLALALTSCKWLPGWQEGWPRTYGGRGWEEGRSVVQTEDGGFVIVGTVDPDGPTGVVERDVWLIRTDSTGDTLWTRTYGGTYQDQGLSVLRTSDGGFVICGKNGTPGSIGLWLIKTDATGGPIWNTTLVGLSILDGNPVAIAADGGYLVVGGYYGSDAGRYVVRLVKVVASGKTQWTRNYGNTSEDLGCAVAATSDGGCIVTGYSEPAGDNADLLLVRFDADGEPVWSKTYGGARFDIGQAVAQTADLGFVVAGEVADDVWLLRTDSLGDTLWARSFGGSRSERGYSVVQTSDNGFIVAGEAGSFCEYAMDVYLVRTDAEGDSLWTRTFGGNSSDGGYSVAETFDGGYIVAGYTYPKGGNDCQVYLIRTDSDGNLAP